MIAFYKSVGGNIGEVFAYHDNPNMVENIEKYTYIEVNEIPDFNIEGKNHKIFIDLATKEMWVEYTDIEETEEELLKDRVAQLEQLVADLASLQLGV